MTRVSTKLRQPPDSERLFEQALAFASSAQVELAALMSRIQNLSEEKPMPYEQIRKAYSLPFPLRPYQVERLNAHCISNLAGLYWEPGCVDSETEYLTPTGWKRIADYQGGPVAQFNPDSGMAEFVEPSQWVKLPCDEMVRVKTTYGLDQMLSPEHRVLVYRGDRQDRREVVTAQSLLDAHNACRASLPASLNGIPFGHAAVGTVFRVAGGPGIPLTDAQLRLQVAVIADGHFGSGTNRCVVRLKRADKIQRLRHLLEDARIEFSERAQETPTAQGFRVFTFNSPLRTKEFGPEFWSASAEQIPLLAAEVTFWDGHVQRGSRGVSFTSVSKASADFVQYLWTSTGQTTRVTEDRRKGKYSGGVCYVVARRGLQRGGDVGALHLRSRAGATVWREPSTDGFKYCFTVPTGFLVLRRNGCIFTTGNSGKTAGSTHWALFRSLEGKADQWVVVMPPILLDQWAKWLRSVKHADTGKSLTVTVYRGTPKQRSQLDLTADFILVSYQVFKNDFEYLYSFFQNRLIGGICDEAQALKNITTQTHKAVRLFFEARELSLLTGTPISNPGDAYAYIRILAPGCYRNQRHFEKLHVGDVDEYGKVTEWINLDLLESNMKINTSRVIRREVQDQLPPVIYTPITYRLDPAHEKLYKRIAEEKLVEFADGREIDAISAQALRTALQQVVINWGEFAGDESLVPAAMDLVYEVLDELAPSGKLVVVANFIRTNRYLLQTLAPYGAVAVYGEISPKDKQKALQTFINNPGCRVLIIHPLSAGVGVDGLQAVCSDMLFLEAPTKAPTFHQTVARLDRDGQTQPVHCRVAIAAGTVQVRMFKSLLDNDEEINAVQGGYEDLKEAIFGN